MTVPIQRACPACESTVRAGGCGDRWHEETSLYQPPQRLPAITNSVEIPMTKYATEEQR